jgi:hypothetical protein
MLRLTLQSISRGDYDYQRIGALIVGACATVELLAQMATSVPPTIPPSVIPLINAALPWARLIAVVVSGLLVKLGKPVVVRGTEEPNA